MRRWQYILIGAVCAVVALLYFHGIPGVYHVDWGGPAPASTAAPAQNLPSAVAAASQAPAPAPVRTIPVVSGTCYLTMAVKVPNPYGWVTYQQDTAFQYLGPIGDRLIVKRGFEEFTVTPEMITGGVAGSLPEATPTPALIAANLPPGRLTCRLPSFP